MSGILNSKVNGWMVDSRLLKYQSLLLEGPITNLKVCGNLNAATFLPEKENETPDHDCSQFLNLNSPNYNTSDCSVLLFSPCIYNYVTGFVSSHMKAFKLQMVVLKLL